MVKVKYDDGKERTLKDIQKLTEQRERNARKFEDFHIAMKEATGDRLELADLVEVIGDHRGQECKIRVLKLWLKSQGNVIALNDDALLGAVNYPPEVAAAMRAAERCLNISDNPSRYWSEESSSFVALPVTDEERQHISRRNERHVDHAANAPLVDFARLAVAWINYSNDRLNTRLTPADISDSIFSGLLPIIKPKKDRPRIGAGPQYELDLDKLLETPYTYRAFDE